jgi:hypothetical protein
VNGGGLRRVIKLAAKAAVVALIVALAAETLRYRRARQIREALYGAFAPVKITNCELRRFGNSNDGGYLMCANLLSAAATSYSYGINGEDAWGCEVSALFKVPVHQYDCFNLSAPRCTSGLERFHAECIGPERATIDGRPFDTFANHVEKNGDVGKRIVVKMDVEGAEWQSLAGAPDHVLNAIDQMAVEFHEVETASFLDTTNRLSEFFYVAHVHQNNYACRPGFDPFPGRVFEVLFVNKRIAVADPWVNARGPSPLDAPNAPALPDCQASPGGNELQRIGRWAERRLRESASWLRRLEIL